WDGCVEQMSHWRRKRRQNRAQLRNCFRRRPRLTRRGVECGIPVHFSRRDRRVAKTTIRSPVFPRCSNERSRKIECCNGAKRRLSGIAECRAGSNELAHDGTQPIRADDEIRRDHLPVAKPHGGPTISVVDGVASSAKVHTARWQLSAENPKQ